MGNEEKRSLSVSTKRKFSAATLAIAAILTQGSAPAQGPISEILDRAKQQVVQPAPDGKKETPPQLLLKPSNDGGAISTGHSSHSSHSSHRSHYSGSGGGGGGGGSPSAPPAEPPPNPPDAQPSPNVIYTVTMKDKRVFKGTVRSDGEQYVITMKEATIRVAKADVQSIERATS